MRIQTFLFSPSMIFISHSWKDRDAASALQAKLLVRDYDSSQRFLDSDVESGIATGEPWQQVLYAPLKDCHALIVLCTQYGCRDSGLPFAPLSDGTGYQRSKV
jgi:hypothetical protein